MDTVFEVDLPQEIKATLSCSCDACAKVLGQSYPKGRKSISIYLGDGMDEEGYPKEKNFHYCDEACLRNSLNKRAEPAK